MAADIWRGAAGSMTAATVQTALFRSYAAVLHRTCLQGETAERERAWFELRVWLAKSARQLERDPAIQEEIVQETLVALQKAMPKSPNAFLVYALQTMKRQHIDLNRRHTAEKRGSGKTLSLEELGQDREGEDGRSWEETLQETAASASSTDWRTIESVVSDQEIRHQMRQFSREHLPTELQQQVFEAHFLDGLTPAETARLLGKQPHEVRLVKARIVKKMRTLPPDAMKQLLAILGRLTPNE